MIASSRSANKFHWSYLHHKCAELLQGEIIIEGSEIELECWHVKVAIAEPCASIVKGQHMLSVILAKKRFRVRIKFEMRTFRKHLWYLSINDRYDGFLLFFWQFCFLLLDSLFHLFSIFSLFTDRDSQTCIDQCLNHIIKMCFMKTYDTLALSRRNHKINQLVTNICILVVDYEPMPPSIKHNFVEVFGFNLPVAYHTWLKSILFDLRNI